MKHLTEHEIVDLVEHAGISRHEEHVSACERCRARVAMMRDAIARIAEADVPEPSPLFWEHLSARVREGVEDIIPDSWWRSIVRSPALNWSVAGALVMLIVVGGVWRRSTQQPAISTAPAIATAATSTLDAAGSDLDDIGTLDNDAAWGLVRTVADDLSWDDTIAAGVAVAPGSADRAIRSLTVAERAELVSLLQSEIKHSGA